jgi:hypothetical protein
MNQEDFGTLKEAAAKSSRLSVDESFSLAVACSRLLGNSEEDKGRELVIRVLENFHRFPDETHPLWNDLIDAAGLYPYLQPERAAGASLLRYEYHSSQYLDGVHFHREQVQVSDLLSEGQSVILSAPTSFGKSLLIQEIVASEKYNNIVIVQPTLALLDETRKKLQPFGDEYRLVVSTSQMPGPGKNVFLFTGERVVEYEFFPSIDFFVIDEFYKLSLERDDERAITLNQALYRLLKHTKRFYLLGPSIRSVTQNLADQTEAKWIHSTYATVAVDVTAVQKKKAKGKQAAKRSAKEEKEARLFDLLATLKEPTMIYCAAPEKAATLALRFSRSIGGPKRRFRGDAEVKELQEWIDENIHQKWALRETVPNGVAFHHGALPRHLGSSIVDAFNSGAILHLFCTSTLIEGVNTTARNVVLFDEAKGKKPIDYFDYKNIVGRSGRMKVHYVGKVFQFAQHPSQMELDVEVPLFVQATAPLELLVQMDRKDLEPIAVSRVQASGIDEDEELRAVVLRNAGVSVDGQINLYREIVANFDYYKEALRWSTIPRYPEMKDVAELIWRFLLKPHDSKGGVTANQLAFMTIQYANNRSVKALIESHLNSDYWRKQELDEDRRIQKVVHLVLNTTRQWFEYRLPKLMGAVSSLQALAFARGGLKPGNYTYLAALLEHSFLRSNLAVLLDYDVPMSAVRKIEKFFAADEPWNIVFSRLRDLDLAQMSLLPYEERKLRAAIATPMSKNNLRTQ